MSKLTDTEVAEILGEDKNGKSIRRREAFGLKHRGVTMDGKHHYYEDQLLIYFRKNEFSKYQLLWDHFKAAERLPAKWRHRRDG